MATIETLSPLVDPAARTPAGDLAEQRVRGLVGYPLAQAAERLGAGERAALAALRSAERAMLLELLQKVAASTPAA